MRKDRLEKGWFRGGASGTCPAAEGKRSRTEKGLVKGEALTTRRSHRILAALSALLLLAALPQGGCGKNGGGGDETATRVEKAATAFLEALGDRDVEKLRSFFTQNYLDSNAVPDPISGEELAAAMGSLQSFRLVPEKDVNVEGDRAVVTVTLEISGKGEREETIALCLVEGEWKVDGFTALNWSAKPAQADEERVAVEQALRDFLIACVDEDTAYIFEHLSQEYKEKHRLENPWTAAEFSGVFGTARSYDFAPEEIKIAKGTAEVDVTVEFGTRGNLESETSRVRLVKKGRDWLIDSFPFFIY